MSLCDIRCMVWGDGGRAVRTHVFAALGAVLLVGACGVGFGRVGLTVGMAVAGLVSMLLAGLAAKGER